MKRKKPVLGQECVTDYGIGRVTALSGAFPQGWVEVKTYADGIARQFDRENVKLIKFEIDDY